MTARFTVDDEGRAQDVEAERERLAASAAASVRQLADAIADRLLGEYALPAELSAELREFGGYHHNRLPLTGSWSPHTLSVTSNRDGSLYLAITGPNGWLMREYRLKAADRG